MSRLLAALALLPVAAVAQTDPCHGAGYPEMPLLAPEVVAVQFRHYVLPKARLLPAPKSAAEWTADARQFRRRRFGEARLAAPVVVKQP